MYDHIEKICDVGISRGRGYQKLGIQNLLDDQWIGLREQLQDPDFFKNRWFAVDFPLENQLSSFFLLKLQIRDEMSPGFR